MRGHRESVDVEKEKLGWGSEFERLAECSSIREC